MSQPLDYIGLLIAFCTIRILPSSNCPFPWGYRVSSPPNTWFLQSLGFIRLHTPNGISIGLPVFVGLAVVTNRRTHRQTETHTDHATSITCSDAPCMCCGPQQLGAQTDIPVCHCDPHHCRHRQLLSLLTTTYLQSSHNHPTFISA